MLNVYISLAGIHYLCIVDSTKPNLGRCTRLESFLDTSIYLASGNTPYPEWVADNIDEGFRFQFLFSTSKLDEVGTTLLELYPEYFI